MGIDANRKEKLITEYRKPLYEAKEVGPKNIDGRINDVDLRDIIAINNNEMYEMIIKDNINKDLMNRLFFANLNFYDLANYRRISIPGKNIMVMAGVVIGYDINKINYILNEKEYEAHYFIK